MKMTKLKYIGLSILNIAKTLMYEFWYYYIKPKDGDRTKLSYTDTDSLIICNKIEDLSKYNANNVARWFNTSNYD